MFYTRRTGQDRARAVFVVSVSPVFKTLLVTNPAWLKIERRAFLACAKIRRPWGLSAMLLISQNFFENNVQADFLSLLSQEDNGPFDTKDEGIKTPLREPTYVVSYPHPAASWSIGQRIADLVDCP